MMARMILQMSLDECQLVLGKEVLDGAASKPDSDKCLTLLGKPL